MVVLSGEMLIKEERTRNSTTSTILLHHRPPLVESQAIVKCARLRGSVSYLDAADGGGGPWLLLELSSAEAESSKIMCESGGVLSADASVAMGLLTQTSFRDSSPFALGPCRGEGGKGSWRQRCALRP